MLHCGKSVGSHCTKYIICLADYGEPSTLFISQNVFCIIINLLFEDISHVMLGIADVHFAMLQINLIIFQFIVIFQSLIMQYILKRAMYFLYDTVKLTLSTK